MEHWNFVKSTGRNDWKKENKNRTKYCEKLLIPTCLAIRKISSKKHTSMLIIQQMRILRIRNVQFKSVCTLEKQLLNSRTTSISKLSLLSVFFFGRGKQRKQVIITWIDVKCKCCVNNAICQARPIKTKRWQITAAWKFTFLPNIRSFYYLLWLCSIYLRY